jgi:UDP-3-O-[3-hydroxymyristoyl] glucosamine N-acyltransferase
MTVTLSELATLVGGEVSGDSDLVVTGLGSLATAQVGELSHLSSPVYRTHLPTTEASCVLVKADDLNDCPCAAIVVANPYLSFARASQLFQRVESLAGPRHPTASIDASAVVHASASIGPNVVIGERSQIAANVRIHANCVIGDDCILEENVELKPNVTLYSQVSLGARTVIHSGAVIGADGFGFTPNEKGHWQGIAQIGGVRVGADVSIGACTCIDRGAIDDTVIEDGVQIDNQVQIGHNCRVGAHSLLCGMVGFAGSTTVGSHCVFGGRSGAGGDHPINVCDGVIVSSCTVLSQSVDQPGIYSGSVIFQEHKKWRRNALRSHTLDELFKRVKKLEKFIISSKQD